LQLKVDIHKKTEKISRWEKHKGKLRDKKKTKTNRHGLTKYNITNAKYKNDPESAVFYDTPQKNRCAGLFYHTRVPHGAQKKRNKEKGKQK